MTIAEAQTAVLEFLRCFTFLRDERTIFEQWFEMVVQNEVQGVNAHDTRLAAAMQRHELGQILTFNVRDFRRFEHVEVLEPSQVIPQSDLEGSPPSEEEP